jgi:intracellular septation protein
MAEKMAEKAVNPGLKTGLELGPALLFFLAYTWLKDDRFTILGTEYSGFIVVTAGFVPVLLASIAALWWLSGRVSRMQILTAVLVVGFGGLTVWFNDEAFFKIKTTVVYGLFALLLGTGLLLRRSWLEYMVGEILPMRHEGWMILTRRLTALFAGLAVANEIVWRTQPTEVWVPVETFGFPLVLMVFLWLQILALRRHLIEDGMKDSRG